MYAECRVGTGFCQRCLGSNPVQRQPETEAPVYQWLHVNVEASVYGIHACTIIVLLLLSIHVNTCTLYIIGDHSLAISGHQGSLSLKHGLCVSASLNSLHTAPLKTGQGHSTCVRSPEAGPGSWGFAKQVDFPTLKGLV